MPPFGLTPNWLVQVAQILLVEVGGVSRTRSFGWEDSDIENVYQRVE
jgi:hypothetical protein